MGYDVWRVREDFPILKQKIYGKPLVYLDNANTTQKPQSVIDAICGYYAEYNSNIHRANHLLSERATRAFEGGREKVRAFLNAAHVEEVIFIRNATEGVNLEFSEDAIDAVADVAVSVNSSVENIGARRLQTVMERVLDDVSFGAPDRSGETVKIDAAYVHKHVGDLAKNADLSRFIL